MFKSINHINKLKRYNIKVKQWLIVKKKLVCIFKLVVIIIVKVKVFGGETGPASIIAPMMGKMKIPAKMVM